jgi:uncharacterized membrane protein
MVFLQLLFKEVPMELWHIILLGILGVSFLAGVVFSIILGIDIIKKISELEEKAKNLCGHSMKKGEWGVGKDC